jgi:putative nucleotidyltransferase with HDIG domain
VTNFLGGTRRENAVALGVGATGLLLLAGTWIFGAAPRSWIEFLLAALLTGLIVLGDRFPIHIRYSVKVTMTSVPLFLLAVLVPRPLAVTGAIIATLLLNTLARKERGLLPVDFLCDAGRWVMIVFLGNIIAFQPLGMGGLMHAELIGAALTMFCADVFSYSLYTSLNIQEPFLRLAYDNIRQIFAVESIQYLIGLLGALAFQQASWAMLLLVVPTMIAYVAFKNVKEMRQGTREMLIHMADAVDLRDPYTGGHSRRVAELTSQIVQHMHISGAEAELIETAARLHDIGKIGIPDAILNKTSAFSPEDRAIMEQHSEKGADLLAGYIDFTRGAEIVLAHHERWDGQGYPQKRKGHEIPLGARVIAVADTFDAITTDRPYRRARTIRQALHVLRQGSGTQWDPDVVATLAEIMEGVTKTSPAYYAENGA